MRDILVTLPQEKTKIKIILLGDVHRGSPQFNEPLFKEVVNLIKENDDYYAILMGDLIDNALKNSKSDVYTAVETPQQSMNWVINTLRPIKDKILAITSGNHEERTTREVGFDLSAYLATCLELEDRYSNEPFCLFVSMGKSQNREGIYQTFCLFGSHGASSGTTIGGAVNKLSKLSDIVVNADVYLMGHTHSPLQTFDPRYEVDTRTKKHYLIEPLLINGQAFLNFEGSYGEKKLYKPKSQRVPIIVLETGFSTKRVSAEWL